MAKHEWTNGRTAHMAASRPNGAYPGHADSAWGSPPEVARWPGRAALGGGEQEETFDFDAYVKAGRPLRIKLGREQVYAVDGHSFDDTGNYEGARRLRSPEDIGRYIGEVIDACRPYIFWFTIVGMIAFTVFKNL